MLYRRSFIKRQMSGASRDNEWQRVVQRVITNDNEWQQVVQRVTTNDKEWQWVVQRVTKNDNEWPFRLIFLFFQIRKEPTTKHPKENSLNLEEDLWRRPIEVIAETSTQEEILTVRSRNCRSSCSQIFIKISVLKNLQFSQENTCVGLQPQLFSCEYCGIFENSFFYRTTLVAAYEKFMKIVWHKNNLTISFSVGSGHPGKYSYEISCEYLYTGEGTS